MKKLMFALLTSGLLATAPALAGPGEGHSHGPISKEQAVNKAEKRLISLVSKGKVDKSWQGKKAAGAQKKTYDGKEEWVVTFNNPALSDKSKQTLYMFFKLDGHYLATNSTGK